MLRPLMVAAALSIFALGVGCSASDGAKSIITGGEVVATFVPTNPSPTDGTVSMTQVSGGNDSMVTVGVQVTEVDGLFSAAFDVTYDPGIARFVSWSRGTVLESGGQSVFYDVSEQPGRIIFGIARGTPTGVNVVGTRTLVNLTFDLRAPGASALAFDEASLQEAQDPPENIPSIDWFGGTLLTN